MDIADIISIIISGLSLIASTIISVVGLIISNKTAKNNRDHEIKLQKTQISLQKEFKESDKQLKKELHESDERLKKELQAADHDHEVKILKRQQDFEKELFYLKQLYESIPYLNEQRQKKIEDIKKYKNVIESVLEDTYTSRTFDENTILTYFDDKDFLSKIEELNKIITEYLRRCNNGQSVCSVFSFKDSIRTQYEAIKPTLNAHIQGQNIINNSYSDRMIKAAAKDGFRTNDVCSDSDTKEYLQDLKKFEDL